MTKQTVNRVTYRPDGRGRLVRDEDKPAVLRNAEPEVQSRGNSKSLSSMEFTTEFKSWSSPFQNDIEAPQDLIRDEALQGPPQEEIWPEEKGEAPVYEAPLHEAPVYETARPTWDVSQHSPWNDSGYVDIKSGPIIDLEPERQSGKLKYSSTRPIRSEGMASGSRRGPSWLVVILSVAGAIGTGALFGYIALTLFAGGTILPANDSEPAAAPASVSTSSTGGSNGSSSEGKASAVNTAAPAATVQTAQGGGAADAVVSANWPASSFSLLQYGVFSAKDSAAAAAKELQHGGLASVTATMGDDYRVYAGLATQRSGAQALAAALSGTEIYIKELSLPAAAKIRYSGDAAAAGPFGALTSGLIGTLADLTGTQLQKDKPGTPSENALAAWNKQLNQWREAAAVFGKGLPGKEATTALGSLQSGVDGAAEALKAYSDNPSKDRLWTVQSRLMDVFFAQRSLIQSVRV